MDIVKRDDVFGSVVLGTSDEVTINSREIAEITGKEHRNICRDIDNMLEQIGGCARFRAYLYK